MLCLQLRDISFDSLNNLFFKEIRTSVEVLRKLQSFTIWFSHLPEIPLTCLTVPFFDGLFEEVTKYFQVCEMSLAAFDSFV